MSQNVQDLSVSSSDFGNESNTELDTIDMAFIEQSLEATRRSLINQSSPSSSSSSDPDSSTSSLMGLGITSGGSPISMGLVNLQSRSKDNDESVQGDADDSFPNMKFSPRTRRLEDFVLIHSDSDAQIQDPADENLTFSSDRILDDSLLASDSWSTCALGAGTRGRGEGGIQSTSTPVHPGSGAGRGAGQKKAYRGVRSKGLLGAR